MKQFGIIQFAAVAAVALPYAGYQLLQIYKINSEQRKWKKRRAVQFVDEEDLRDQGICFDLDSGEEITYQQYLMCGETFINIGTPEGFHGMRKDFSNPLNNPK